MPLILGKTQGKNEEAIPFTQEALSIWRKIHGEEHPSVATGLVTLGFFLQKSVRVNRLFEKKKKLLMDQIPFQGKLSEAAPLFYQSLEIYKKIYGEEHPHVAAALNNIAALLRQQVRL